MYLILKTSEFSKPVVKMQSPKIMFLSLFYANFLSGGLVPLLAECASIISKFSKIYVLEIKNTHPMESCVTTLATYFFIASPYHHKTITILPACLP